MALLSNFNVTIDGQPIEVTVSGAAITPGSSTVFSDSDFSSIGLQNISVGQVDGTVTVEQFLIACADNDLFKFEFVDNSTTFYTFYTSSNNHVIFNNLIHVFPNTNFNGRITRIGSDTSDIKIVVIYSIV